MIDYAEFLASKRIVSDPCGISVRREDLNPLLLPWQADITAWALQRGRAAIFSGCGTGKTFMQSEWAQHVSIANNAPVLGLAPLEVAEQTAEEALKFGITVTLCASMADVQPGINFTNYEKLHKFSPRFAGMVLDESSILKAFDGKTRQQITAFCADIPYRLACTATPAPNDHVELGNHAEFLGVMKMSEMLATFFVHDGGDTSKWRLKGHAADDFWRWVASWSVTLRKPSDLGYSDEGFTLPPLTLHQVTVATSTDGLMVQEAATLQERNVARRESITERVAAIAERVNASTEQWLIFCQLNDESSALVKAIPDAIEVSGSGPSSTDAHRKMAARDFKSGAVRVVVTKTSIWGWGLNLQHCARLAFFLSDSWESFFQGVRRCWRFGQSRPVEAYIITSDREGAVVRNIERKEKQAAEMAEELVKHTAAINSENVRGACREQSEYVRDVRSGDGWTAHLGDSVEVFRETAADSIDYMIYSPPFASLYTYSNSDRDMGNCRNYEDFFAQYRFLVAELYRTLKPGRLLSFHCMNLPTSKQFHGYIGIQDFRGDLIRAHQAAGFIFHSEVCIWKDPVTAMQRTKALGLLHKQVVKDSCMSRQGVPDYLVTMRKPGANAAPVAGEFDTYVGDDGTGPGQTDSATRYSIEVWQRYASPVWMDINPSNTLQRNSAREDKDERHICPLQLQVIQRALELWTNPGDLVASPFGGIGSEGYVALKTGRRALICELKRSYWEQACRNLASVEGGSGEQFSLLDPDLEAA